MTNELKPCPMCGSNDVQETHHSTNFDSSKLMSVNCKDCYVSVLGEDGQAAERWNTRTPPEVSKMSPEFEAKIDKIAKNARWCQDAVIDDLVEWLCKEGHQGRKFRAQVEQYKAMIKAAQEQGQ